MSPRLPDPQMRTQLIETAARLLAEEGPRALTTRRLAAEVGTSTMAVYTYFSGMEELRRAVRVEGFDRLADHLSRVGESDDSVTELAELGSAYFANAFTNPHLYRFMFMEPRSEEEGAVGLSTFERLVEGVDRAIKAGRIHGEPWDVALQMWVCVHGIVTLHLAGLLARDDALRTGVEMTLNLLAAFGDDHAAARRSFEAAQFRVPASN